MQFLKGLLIFVVVCLGVQVVINLITLVLGLQHPDLPAWWRSGLSTGTALIGFVLGGLAAWGATRRRKAPPPPFRG